MWCFFFKWKETEKKLPSIDLIALSALNAIGLLLKRVVWMQIYRIYPSLHVGINVLLHCIFIENLPLFFFLACHWIYFIYLSVGTYFTIYIQKGFFLNYRIISTAMVKKTNKICSKFCIHFRMQLKMYREICTTQNADWCWDIIILGAFCHTPSLFYIKYLIGKIQIVFSQN